MSGRIRSIKPEWKEDELLAATSDAARVLSVALILMADDYGRGRASIATIATETWRYEMERDNGAEARETIAKASRALRELVEIEFVVLYEVAKQRYFAIRNWAKHQRVDKPGNGRVPAPNQAESLDSQNPRETLARDSGESRKTLALDLRSPISDQDHDHDHVRARGPEEPTSDTLMSWFEKVYEVVNSHTLSIDRHRKPHENVQRAHRIREWFKTNFRKEQYASVEEQIQSNMYGFMLLQRSRSRPVSYPFSVWAASEDFNANVVTEEQAAKLPSTG